MAAHLQSPDPEAAVKKRDPVRTLAELVVWDDHVQAVFVPVRCEHKAVSPSVPL